MIVMYVYKSLLSSTTPKLRDVTERLFMDRGVKSRLTLEPAGCWRPTCCLVHRRWGRCWGCRTQTERWRTGWCSWKTQPLEKKEQSVELNLLSLHPPGLHSLLLASHSARSTPAGNAVRALTSVCVIRWLTYCCCRYGRSSRLLLIPLGEASRGLMREGRREEDGKYGGVKSWIGQWINGWGCSF